MTPKPDQPISRDPVEELAEAFLDRYRRGEKPSVSEFVARAPEHAAEIRELFPALVLMERADPAAVAPWPLVGTPLERLGDYRLIREIGRGGMGIVFEARQEALGRHVALKVLPPGTAPDGRALIRFRREARSAARLHHTNIVPVFDVGERDGVHYYAMQFIAGQALDEVIVELRRLRQAVAPGTTIHVGDLAEGLVHGPFRRPESVEDTTPVGPHDDRPADATSRTGPTSTSWSNIHFYRNVARIGVQVADALAYAHSQGVIHRDIKPSNVLLDAAGCAWVTDFGLAKEEGDDLTEKGDVVGTLRYLAPERLNGTVDPRGDVYGLGLTLYELLTLQPAFAEVERVRLVQQIASQEPVAPRKLAPHLPRDLETIVLRASAKEPSRRYATAADLADDLRRFLADRPIRARRSSPLEHGWRWCRRNPGWAGTAAAVLALLLVIAGGGAILNLSLQRALTAADVADRDKTEQLWRSHLERARALCSSGRVGQRFEALAVIREAARIKVTDELRDVAVAALVLPDVEREREWDGFPEDTLFLAHDANFSHYARMNKTGELTICRVGDRGEEVLARAPADRPPPYRGLWMSPDGRYVAYGHGSLSEGVAGDLRILRVDGPTLIALSHEPASVLRNAVTFHRDGRLAVCGEDGVICLYDLESPEPPRKRSIGEGANRLAFNPKDGRLAASCDHSIRLFEEGIGRELPALHGPEGHSGADGIAWHPDGLLLAAGCQDRKIRIWDARAREEVVAPLDGHPAGGIDVMFNHTGDRLLSTSWDRQTRLWDAVSGRLLLTWPEQVGSRFGSGGSTIGLGREGRKLSVWRLADGRELRFLRRPHATDRGELYDPVLGANERVIAVGSPTGVAFLDLASGRELAAIRTRPDDGCSPRSFDPRDGWMTCGGTGALLWPAHPDPARAGLLRVGPPRRLAPSWDPGADATPDGRVRVIPQRRKNLEACQTLVLDRDRPDREVVLKPQHDVRYAAVSRDGNWAATCSWFRGATDSPIVRIWDTATGRQVASLPVDEQARAGFSPDGKWLAVHSVGRGCRLWEVGTREPGTWKPGRQFASGNFSWHPGGRFLLLNDILGVIRFLDPETGNEVIRLTGPEAAWYVPAAVTADGATLIGLVGDTSALCVWDLRRIRAQLRDLKLDWELPEFPPPAAVPGAALTVVPDTGFLRQPPIPNEAAAVAVHTVALSFLPLNPDAYYWRGVARMRARAKAEAVADFEQFLVMAPRTDTRRPLAQVWAAEMSVSRREWSRALPFLIDLLEAPPELVAFPEVQAYLCDEVARQLAYAPNARPSEAVLRLAEKAAELKPTNSAYQHTRGVVHYRLGRFADAIWCLEANVARAEESAPDDLYFLAMCYARLNQYEPALAYLRRASTAAAAVPNLALGKKAELLAIRVEAVREVTKIKPK